MAIKWEYTDEAECSWFQPELLYRWTQRRADFIFASHAGISLCSHLFSVVGRSLRPMSSGWHLPWATWNHARGGAPVIPDADDTLGDVRWMSVFLHPWRWWFGVGNYCRWVPHVKLAPSWLLGVMVETVRSLTETGFLNKECREWLNAVEVAMQRWMLGWGFTFWMAASKEL